MKALVIEQQGAIQKQREALALYHFFNYPLPHFDKKVLD